MVRYLIGIDEVGRGPIAGPVAVGSFVFIDPKVKRLFKGVRESKQLTEEKREFWFEKIQDAKRKGHINFSVVFQSEKVIDQRGISFAIKKALTTSLKNLKINPKESKVLLDGGLKAPVEYIYQKTIIKGDAKEMVIALASICAKVTRDRRMKKWGKVYPQYGFEVHKGYGTRVHRDAIKKYGMMALHRASFCKSITIDNLS